ncbi:MAG: hypothetical protein L0Y66_25375, partial [Myxococcaceae bacterium]|nr:hypothetical protein [Myxococcaceae bacterium]
MRRLVLVASFALAVSAQGAEVPQPPPIPNDRLVVSNLLVARVNPVGLESQLRAGYQHRLYASEATALRDNFVFVGMSPRLNPAGVKGGPTIELQPLSVLNLRATWDYVAYFGTFGTIQGFQGPSAAHSDASLLLGQAYATTGSRLTLEALLQAKLGPFALRARVAFERWSLGLRDGERVFYEAGNDTLHPNNGWILNDDVDLLYVTEGPLIIGARYSSVLPFFGSEHVATPLEAQDGNGHSRLGLLGVYLLPESGSPTFSRPAIIANIAWYLGHRY